LTQLILKRASASRPSGEWNDDDYDVLADGVVVGRIMKAAAAPIGTPRMWTLAFGYHEDRTPTHGYAATRVRRQWRRSPKAGGGSRRAMMDANEDPRAPYKVYEGDELKGTYATRAEARRRQQQLESQHPNHHFSIKDRDGKVAM
jgi:hypothetical protein